MTEQPSPKRRPYGALVVLAVLILAVFVRQRHSDIVPVDVIEEQENYVDTYTIDVQSTQFGKDGKIKRTLSADYAAHYALSDESILQAPAIERTSETGKIWRTSARNGKVRAGGDVFDLWNTVLITRLDGDLLARSDTLTFYSDRGQVETNDEVIIDSRIGQTIGVGMSANLNSEVLRLNSKVRSVFDPPQ